ncbi:hypothetical protein LMIY3S_01867 [Labrys miyagiensis]
MRAWTAAILTSAMLLAPLSAPRSQQAPEDQVANGRRLALMICGACHVVASDPANIPILDPPAQDLQVRARRSVLPEAVLRQMLTSDHSKVGPGEAMPNPQLVDYQIDAIIAYFQSLRGNR